MKWIRKFQHFLFDFDGLLVNTEPLQFQAYVNMLAKRGIALDWSFAKFCEVAHLNSSALKEALYAEIPNLDPNWKQLYQEKKEEYLNLLLTGKIELMPGAEDLLKELAAAGIRRSVVTHSILDHTMAIRSQHPVLRSIPSWVTREDYDNPKPDPECYLRAIQLYGEPGDRIIGFEDSLRGLKALQGTPALPVLICPQHHPLLDVALEGNALHFETFSSIRESDIP